MICSLYCQQGGRTERTDKEFTAGVVDVESAVVRNAATDTAVTGDIVRLLHAYICQRERYKYSIQYPDLRINQYIYCGELYAFS